MPITTVLLDLDDTLYDHSWSCRRALAALRQTHPGLRRHTLTSLAHRHLELLNQYHLEILAKRETTDSARAKRYRDFFAGYGIDYQEDELETLLLPYRHAYEASRRAVPGARALIAALVRRGVTIGVCTNHYSRTAQRQKLIECGFDTLVHNLFVSADLGCSKPDPALFHTVLDRLGSNAASAVMLGDSFTSDVAGALRAGMRAVWLNRFRSPRPHQITEIREIRSLRPVHTVLQALLG